MKRYNGQEVTLDELYQFLRRFSLTDSLYIIGVISNAFKYGSIEINKKQITPALQQWIDLHFRENHEKMMLQFGLVRLARFLILSGSNDQKGIILDINRTELIQAIYMSMNVYESKVDGGIGFHKIFGRLAQWQFPLQDNKATLLGRGYLLFDRLPDTLSGDYSIKDKMMEYFGIDPFSFMSTGFSLWIMYSGIIEENLIIEIPQLKNFVSKQSIQTFIDLSKMTFADYRSRIRVGNYTKMDSMRDMYALDPFYIKPILNAKKSHFGVAGRYFTPNPHAFLHRSSSGIFYILSDKEQEIATTAGQSKRNPFRTYFGNVFREYVRMQLALGKDITLIDLDSPNFLNENSLNSRADFLHIENDICIIYEVKTGLLKLDSRMYFDEKLTREEVQEGSLKKSITQLNLVENYIKENNLKVEGKLITNIKTIIKIIVGYEDIYLANGFIIPFIQEYYSNNGSYFQIMTVSDIESLGTRLAQNMKVFEMLKEKVEDAELTEWNVTAYLNDRAKVVTRNPILESGYSTFMTQIDNSYNHSDFATRAKTFIKNIIR